MAVKSRNLFRLSRFILLRLPAVFKLLARIRTPKKRLLIIKTDAIGDYVLFRNFIEVIKCSGRYRGYKLDLLGNTLWQNLSQKCDAQFINEFIFIQSESLYHKPLKVLRLAFKLFNNSYETVLQPSFTRRLITDGLAGLTGSRNIIGFDGDLEGIDARYKLKTDRFYTQLLSLPSDKFFEFDRNRYFFEIVLGYQLSIVQASIGFEARSSNGIVVFPGAGVTRRSWEKEKFSALIKLTLAHSDVIVYLAGNENEVASGAYLSAQFPQGRVINLINKTSLPGLIELIGNSRLVISNETSAMHIAAAANTKTICISGGGHFKRFAPYPAHIENKPTCIYQKMDCFNCNWNCIYKIDETEPYPCISAISVDMVWKQLSRELALL